MNDVKKEKRKRTRQNDYIGGDGIRRRRQAKIKPVAGSSPALSHST
jgi:hypothetical protein